MSMAPIDALIRAAEDLVEAVTFDDSGTHGQGGNGGLLSRETIRKADALRLAICAARRAQRDAPPSPRAGEGRGEGGE